MIFPLLRFFIKYFVGINFLKERIAVMPIFEYKCKKCSKVFEELILLSSSDDVITCPKCGSKDLIKLFSKFSSNVSEESSGLDLGSTSSSCPTCSLDTCSTCK